MNRLLAAGLCGLAAAFSAAAGDSTYQNDGFVIVPPAIAPNIDAKTFVNDGWFVINLTNYIPELPPQVTPQPYEMKGTYNYTNAYGAWMAFNSGLRAETWVKDGQARGVSANFHNEGTIDVGTISTSNTLGTRFLRIGLDRVALSGSAAGTKLIVRATNIYSPGEINLGFEGMATLYGQNVNLDHGGVNMEQAGYSEVNSSLFFNGGIFDGYWGLSTNAIGPMGAGGINPDAYFGARPPLTPPHAVTNRMYETLVRTLGDTNFVSYLVDELDASGSNRTVRAVFLANTNAEIQANVYFPQGATVVEWTNTAFQADNLYLYDRFGFDTNFLLLVNGFSGVRPTYIPWNYDLFTFPGGFFSYGVPADPTIIPPSTFNTRNTTNQYSAYQALFRPNSVVLPDTFGQTYSNSPGRIEIVGSNLLSLAETRVKSLNFLKLAAYNHFQGSPGAAIVSPYSDIYLRTTNGELAISNLLQPTLARPEGTIDLYSARWTNVTGTITNAYHVLFVDTRLAPEAPTRIGNLTLRSTNVSGGGGHIYISDVLNILSNNPTFESSKLTITTNEPETSPRSGAINFLDSAIVWSEVTPRLEYFTNAGWFVSPNAVYFRGSRHSPYYSGNYNERYRAMVNLGGITNFSSRIYAEYFENSGNISATQGAIELHEAACADLDNGSLLAPGASGSITLEAGTLLVSNTVLNAGAALNLAVTNLVDDGTFASGSADNVTNRNDWLTGNGFNLKVPGVNGSLLGTTIENRALPNKVISIQWAGRNLGTNSAGFIGNVALGHAVLDGAVGSKYQFKPVNGNNAIYIDRLDLRGHIATNVNPQGNWLSLDCDAGMKVYFGQATADGADISRKLAEVNQGKFQWVRDYNTGFFSSTNLVYPDGTTNRLNTALVTDCTIDSDGDGIPNCMDPSPVPILSSAGIAMMVGVTQTPKPAAVISWYTFPASTNYLYAAPSFDSPNWTPVTNFFYPGPYPGRVTVSDEIKTNAPRFYRVRVGLR